MRSRSLRLAVDVSPLTVEPRRGVARALTHLLAGFAALDEVAGGGVEIVRHAPRPGESSRTFRRRMRDDVRAVGTDAWYAPWSAFPDVDVPVVVCVHELPFVRCGPIEGRLRTVVHRRWLARDVARAAAIVVPSRATRDDLLALHPSAHDRVHVVPHGFGPRVTAAAATAPAAPARPATVVVLGGRGPRKGMDVLADALERRPTGEGARRVVIVGRPPRAVAARLAARADVTILDDPSDDDVRALLAAASLLVYPSRSEGFGFPPLEAMALGVPVVASDAGSIPEVCGDAARLVAAGDGAALATAIDAVLADPGLAADLVARGRARARAFDPRATAGSLLKIVRAAVERGGA